MSDLSIICEKQNKNVFHAAFPLQISMTESRSISSPAMSFAATAQSNLSTATSSTLAQANVPTSGINYAELFQDIDWAEVDLIRLESEWRAELEQIERVSLAFCCHLISLLCARKMFKLSWIQLVKPKSFFLLCIKQSKRSPNCPAFTRNMLMICE